MNVSNLKIPYRVDMHTWYTFYILYVDWEGLNIGGHYKKRKKEEAHLHEYDCSRYFKLIWDYKSS